jgi:hypothetical protein
MPNRIFFGFLAALSVLLAECTIALPIGGVTIRWNNAALQGIRDTKRATPTVTRLLAIAHTCMYDAWAAYDEKAIGTQLSGALRRPPSERTLANKEKAVSYAAYRALSDVLPADIESVYKPLMKELGYDPNNNSTDIETPEGIGNVACGAVLEFRHHDKSNQLGDMPRSDNQVSSLVASAAGPYSDWTGYTPVNSPGTVPARSSFTKPLNPDHWQPLAYTDASGNLVVQMFSGAQWAFVTPLALVPNHNPAVIPNHNSSVIPNEGRDLLSSSSPNAFNSHLDEDPDFRSAFNPLPAKFGTPEYQRQADELISLSANLTDAQKIIAEYWTASPDTESAVEHWFRIAEFISDRDRHSLDDDVKMFFALSNAMMDADIAAWDAKRYYDSVRPATAIPLLFRGKTVKIWGGPGKGAINEDGGQWIPYQLATYPTPPSPEYVSEVSAESAAAAQILKSFTGSDRFADSVTLSAKSSRIEPGISPAKPVAVKWETFTDAADQAGLAGRYAGIHFAPADLAGRKLGRLVAARAFARAQLYFSPSSPPRAN